MAESNRGVSGAAAWWAAISRHIVPSIGDNFIWVLVAILAVGAWMVNPVFLSSQNLLNILRANAHLGALVLGVSLVIITKNIDISFEANMVFTAIIGGFLMMAPPTGPGAGVIRGGAVPENLAVMGGLGWTWPLALSAMLVLSSFIGLLNGFLVAKLRMNPFMATLAMMVALMGLSVVRGKGQLFVGFPSEFLYVGSANIGSVPVVVLFMLVVFVIAAVVLRKTTFGAHLYAVGGNRRAARAAGINDDWTIISAFVLCGFFAGLAALIVMGRLGSAGAQISADAVFPVIAAAIIGGVSLYGGRGGVGGMVGGLLLIGMITNILNLSAIPSQYIKVVMCLIILIALSIDAFQRRGQARE